MDKIRDVLDVYPGDDETYLKNIDDGKLYALKENPVDTVKGLLGNIDLDNDAIEKIVDGIKAKISLDKLGGALGGLFGKK